MDDIQVDVMTVLLAQHIVDIARSNEHVAFALRERLSNVAAVCDNETRDAIAILLDDMFCHSVH